MKLGIVLADGQPDLEQTIDATQMEQVSLTRIRALLLAMLFGLSLLAGCVTIQPLTAQPPITANERVKITQTSRGAVINVAGSELFNPGEVFIRPESSQLLSSLADTLNNKTRARVLIESHTDSSGNAKDNQLLSENRAVALRNGLIERSVLANRMTTVGFGQDSPLASNATESGRAANQRIEIILVGESYEVLNAEGSIFRNLGNHLDAAVSNVSLATQNLATSMTKHDKNLRSRYMGPVTHCPQSADRSLIIIDSTNVSPAIVGRGKEIQHAIDAQVCVENEGKKDIEQSVNVIHKGKTIFRSPMFVHEGKTRSKQQFFTSIGIPDEAPRGKYEVESVIKLDGRFYKQTTPFEVQ